MTHAELDDVFAMIRRGEQKKLIKWLRKGRVDATRPVDGNSLLHQAVIHKQPDLVRELLSRGAPVDLPNNDGSTALMAASQVGAVIEVEMLLRHAADVNKQTPRWGSTALMAAASAAQPDVLSLLLKASAFIDAQTTCGSTALMIAAERGADDCVRRLLDAGSSIELQDNMGHTALIHALVKGQVSTHRLLQEASSPPAPLSGLASGAATLKMTDARLTVPARTLHQASCTEARRQKRDLYRASGLLTRDLCIDSQLVGGRQ